MVRRSRSHITWRVARGVAGIVAAVASFCGAAVALFFGVVVTTGCFIGCTEPDPLAGVPILFLAVALVALGLAALWWGFFNRHWRRAWTTLGILSSVATIALLSMVATAN